MGRGRRESSYVEQGIWIRNSKTTFGIWIKVSLHKPMIRIDGNRIGRQLSILKTKGMQLLESRI
jgi:hypothetical protein